jgi:alpha-L-rhamnosidase
MFAELADLLGKTGDAAEYRAARERSAKAFHEAFFDPKTLRYGDDQTPNALVLRFDLVPEESSRETAAKSLASLVRDTYDGHMWTGIYGTKYLPEALYDAGETDLAIEALRKDTYPGFGHQIAMGATTVWEQWHYQHGMETHNHAMFSGTGASFFSRLGGLSSISGAFEYALVKPCVPALLNEVECVYESVRGTYRVYWKKEGGRFTLELTVPPNCRARVQLPDGVIKETGNGKFSFSCGITKNTLVK